VGQIRAADSTFSPDSELKVAYPLARPSIPRPPLFFRRTSFPSTSPYPLPPPLATSSRCELSRLRYVPSLLPPLEDSFLSSLRKGGSGSECPGGSKSSSISDNNERWTRGLGAPIIRDKHVDTTSVAGKLGPLDVHPSRWHRAIKARTSTSEASL
jgi:hypothetical protein